MKRAIAITDARRAKLFYLRDRTGRSLDQLAGEVKALIVTSTRRFAARPAAVEFEAAGTS